MAFGISVTTSEAPQASGSPTSTGTAFFVGAADEGPSTATLCLSTNDYVRQFGPRTTNSSALYDAVDVFFREGGSRVYVANVTDNTATRARLTLNDAGGRPTVDVTALSAGVAGNSIFIAVEVDDTDFTVEVQDADGDMLETHGPLAATSDLFGATSGFVRFTQSAGSGFTTNDPRAATATPLAGGTNPSDLTDDSYLNTLNAAFPPDLGPGQVAIPGKTSSAIRDGVFAHGAASNRFALVDLADSPSVATLVTSLGGIGRTRPGSYGAFLASSCTIPGLTLGTTRTVAGSAVAAALYARVAATGNDNQAPAGPDWPLSYVTGFTNTFTAADIASLNGAGINPWAVSRSGVLYLYGDQTPVLIADDLIFNQASASRERMAIIADAQAIAEPYMFKTLDGQGKTVTAFKGDLQGLIAAHWQAGALFGLTAVDAGTVQVDPPVNTPTTEANGQLNAVLNVRISPTVESVSISIVFFPITVALS